MVEASERHRMARESTRERILQAAIALFGERGLHATSVALIAKQAGVAQGLVNYHFTSKDELAGAVVDRWFETLVAIAQLPPLPADVRLSIIIDHALSASAQWRELQNAMIALQQPANLHIFAAAEQRNAEAIAVGEQAVQSVFRERGAADPVHEERMLRTLLEGVSMKHAVYGDAYPLDQARTWVYGLYGLDPTQPSPLAGMSPEGAEG